MVILPGLNEIYFSLRGAWRLFWRDEAGYEDFDNTAGGFWRSFAVIVLIFPLYFIAFHAEQRILLLAANETEVITRSSFVPVAAALIIDWFAYPALMAYLVRLFDLGGRYVPYIIAYNWTSLLLMVFMMPAFLLFLGGVIEPGTAMGLNFTLTVFALYIHWYVAYSALKVNGIQASAFVAIDLLMSLTINMGIDRLAG